jgi:hypothetical protein
VATQHPIKQEVFLFEFDLAKLLGPETAPMILPIEFDTAQKTFMFIINVRE